MIPYEPGLGDLTGRREAPSATLPAGPRGSRDAPSGLLPPAAATIGMGHTAMATPFAKRANQRRLPSVRRTETNFDGANSRPVYTR